MPVHDWTRVGASTFHDFHPAWIVHLRDGLNGGVLPSGFYAQTEQHMGRRISDVLTLHASDPERLRTPPQPPEYGTVAVAEAPPWVSRTVVLTPTTRGRHKTLTIRHVTGHRIIALIEIVSPSNKATAHHVGAYVKKAKAALRAGIHLLVIDLLPPGQNDPEGIHGAIMEALAVEEDELPEGKPLTFASFAAARPPVAYLSHLGVGEPVPDMPLFLTAERYVNAPLESSYAAAYRGVPEFWREMLEGVRSHEV